MYHTGGLGSVAALSQWNTAGLQVEIVERYRYDDVFGRTTVCDGNGTPRTVNASDYGNPILFTGRRLDVESGLYDTRARIYSPALGRFLQTDPIGYIDGMNLYAYVNNNPLNWLDPRGLCKEDAITIDAQDWEEYLQSVYDDVQKMSPVWYHALWPIRAKFYDTVLYDSDLYLYENAKHALYYIEPLDMYVYGWEINYVGQGMLYERFVIIPGLGNVYAYARPFTWKTINAWGNDYKVKDAFNRNMYRMTTLGTREYSRIRKERQKGR